MNSSISSRLPKADFAADVTLAAPGTKITFESLCSANTETVNWTFAGADIETAEGESVSVSYPEEGIYSVKVTAVNKAGSIEKEKEIEKQVQDELLEIANFIIEYDREKFYEELKNRKR